MKKTIAFAATLLPFVSFAHHGHGNTEGFTIIHYLLEPAHLIPVMIVSVVACFLYKKSVQRKNKA